MRPLSRRLARLDAVRTAAVLLAVTLVAVLISLGFASYYTQPTPGGLVAALAVLGIVGSGLLYAWRPGTGGLSD